jgi:hypothetical protein
MTYKTPELVVLGSAVRVIESLSNKSQAPAEITVGNPPAYDLDE